MQLALGGIIDLFSIKLPQRFAGCCCMTCSNVLKRGIRGILLLLKSALPRTSSRIRIAASEPGSIHLGALLRGNVSQCSSRASILVELARLEARKQIIFAASALTSVRRLEMS
jgi:hypothetical protein